ncbi:MAG: permease [Sphingomonadales bacterium BRH_c42]|nr:MAG: permease [Sphingomonadales bacterium BRH_c42]
MASAQAMEKEGALEANLAAPRGWLLLAGLLVANVALALGPWFVRLADSGPVAAGFWRLLLPLPFFVLMARRTGQSLGGIPCRTMFWIWLGAITFGLDLAAWHVGIEYTRLGNAALFGNSGSLVVMFWGFIMARHLPHRFEWLAIAFALAGTAILMGRSLEISTATLIGDLFCLAAGLLYAVYLITLQDARKHIGAWSLLVWVSLFACPLLLALAIALGEPVWPQQWGPLVALAFFSQIVGQGLLVWVLRHFSPLVIGLALLTQPAVAALTGYAVFGEVLSPLDLLGMAMVGGALVIARARRG